MHSIRAWFSRGTPIGLLILGLVVGLGGAVGAALFHSLIYLSTLAFYGHDGSVGFISLIETLTLWQRLLIPTLGGLLVGIIFAIAKVDEAEGEGVPEVMEALAEKRGRIRPIVAPLKIITAAITLGSGGSAGREGPVIQIGSAIGSTIAQLTKQATENRRLLLAAGAAAGIGGTFGAPIAGVLFTLEILHHRPKLLQTSVVILASFVGAFLARLIIGHEGLRFVSPELTEVSFSLIAGLFLLSITAVLVALAFGKIFRSTHTVFRHFKLPHVIKPALGGFMIGLLGLFLPYLHEPATYPLMVDLIAVATMPLIFLVVLLALKMLATSITLGSGGSGGIFAPLLLMGAITGSILGSGMFLLGLAPESIIPVLVVVGMATVFASAAHAPLTAAFITYEMTENIVLLPLLVICCLIASTLAKRINPESLYRIHHDDEEV